MNKFSKSDSRDVEEKDERARGSRSNSKSRSFSKGKGKGKGKRNYTREEGKGALTGRGACDPDSANDPMWYAASPQLLSDAASLAYSNALGSKYNISQGSTGLLYPTQADQHVSGVMAIRYLPGPGISTAANSAVNIAARNIYSFVRHANSGHANYDSPDLMMYLLAMDNVYGMWSYLVRVYGVARFYNQKNRYLPKILLRSMGVDPDSIQSNLADLRYFINAMANKIGALCVPTTMPYFMRHLWMNQNIFVDSPNEKAQVYLYVPSAYYTYVETEGAGSLRGTALSSNSFKTYDELKTILESMMDALMGSEDINIMSGDILKAYQGKVWKLEQIPADYTVLPTYSEEVLSQIENLIANGAAESSSLDVTQDANGTILYQPTCAASPGCTFKTILNMHHDIVTPADTMVATRLTTATAEEDVSTSDGKHAITTAGSEIVEYVNVFTISTSSPYYTASKLTTNSTPLSMEILAGMISTIEPFDWHPCFRFYVNDAAQTSTFKGMLMLELVDYDNYTLVDMFELDKMHTTALLSEFNVPLMGAVTG